MKITRKAVSLLVAGLLLQQMAHAQTSTNALDMGGPPAVADSNQPVDVSSSASTADTNTMADTNAMIETNAMVESNSTAGPVMPAETNTMAETNPPAETSMATGTNTMENNSATAATNAGSAVSMAATNEMAGSTNETAAATEAQTNATPATPPIILQDTPLTTAIEALAREANINYLMDPRIGYGQADEKGNVKPEPNISVRWENVTYQQALVALLDNYGLQMVENPKTKIYKITLKDPTAPPPLITRVIQLKYASTTNMMAAISSSFTDRRSRVLPDTRTSQLIVVATDPEQSSVDNLVNQLDKPTRQVLIETKIVELSSNPSTKKGIDWSGTLDAQNVSFGNNVSQGGRYTYDRTVTVDTNLIPFGINPLKITETFGAPQSLASPQFLMDTSRGINPSIGFLDADGVKAVISFLNASSDAQVVSTPRVVTLDNETATIEVTRAFPIFNTTAGTQGSPGGSQLTYSNLGTILEVTPRISANDYIWLKVKPEVSSFFGTVTKTVGGLISQADEFDVRRIDTQVLIPNSHTLVMGGLVKDNPNAQYTKVPFLGDIPILGLAFRHENKSLEKDNLLLFITPTIVKDSDFRATTSTFLESEPRQMPDPMNPKTMYDGASPRGDWTNPLTPNVQ